MQDKSLIVSTVVHNLVTKFFSIDIFVLCVTSTVSIHVHIYISAHVFL